MNKEQGMLNDEGEGNNEQGMLNDDFKYIKLYYYG
jgi:hypothetical protein